MKTEVKSLYWVSSAYDAPGTSAFKLDVLESAETMDEVTALGGVASVERPYNVKQAVAKGWTLAKVAAAINADLATRLEDAQVAQAQAAADLQAANDRIAELEAAISSGAPAS